MFIEHGRDVRCTLCPPKVWRDEPCHYIACVAGEVTTEYSVLAVPDVDRRWVTVGKCPQCSGTGRILEPA